jgi:hypothetical protein
MRAESEATIIYLCHRFEALLEGAWRAPVEEVATVSTLLHFILFSLTILLSHHLLSPATPIRHIPTSPRLPLSTATVFPSSRLSTLDTRNLLDAQLYPLNHLPTEQPCPTTSLTLSFSLLLATTAPTMRDPTTDKHNPHLPLNMLLCRQSPIALPLVALLLKSRSHVHLLLLREEEERMIPRKKVKRKSACFQTLLRDFSPTCLHCPTVRLHVLIVISSSAASSPRSLGSAAMDESDSEDGTDFDHEAPLYPIEGKFRSEADRAEVMAMTEIRREEILAERAAEVERRVQDLQLKKILQQRKREQAGADKRKRKAAAADLDDDDQRKSSRPKVKASGPLEAYKREREMKGQQRNRGDERRRDRSPSRDDRDSDRDADGDSEVEWDEKPRAAAAAARDEAPATLRDFERARIGRTNFARVCFYPTFETSIRNCYARVSIGVNRDTGAPQYRMAQIKSRF